MLTHKNLHAMPKIDLHRHFEGSLRLETLAELANQFDLPVPRTIHELRPLVQVTDDPPNAHTFLGKFEVLRNFYCSPETIRRLAYEIVADAAADNVHYLELRFSPQALSRVQGFALDEVTDWVITAVDQAQNDLGIVVTLIVTLLRHEDLPRARQVAEIAFARRHKGIVGLDLAGDEVNHSAVPFSEIFQQAKSLGMGITIHAGEWMGAEEVRTAVELLGADRIGHGVNIVSDSQVAQLIRKQNIPLEICLTSNIQTGSVAHLHHHPIQDFLDMQLPVTLNTDDPTVSNITLTDEYQLALSQMGLTYTDLRRMTLTAIDSAFLPPARQKKLRRYFDRLMPDARTVTEKVQKAGRLL